MLNELEELAPTNAATFNGVTLIAPRARELTSMLKQRLGTAKLTIVFPA